MDKKVIGIIGGMGPLATADLYRKIITHTDAVRDQDHPRVVIDSNTDVPDRTEALLRGGPDPVPEILKSARRLAGAGADLLLIPCNTSHAFFDRIADGAGLPVLNMIALTRDALLARGVRAAGLLATDGTLETRVYQKAFEGSGVTLLTPPPQAQRAVMDVIYNGVKAGNDAYDASTFRAACDALLAQGAQTLILGCTELPPAFSTYGLDFPVTDPTLELALAAIRAAGCRVKE